VTRWPEIARAQHGDDYAAAYAARFRELAEAGEDVHGEARFVHDLLVAAGRPRARVLDAGCGTGRTAVHLHELGHDVVGVDADPAMVAQAAADAPHLRFEVVDLARADEGLGRFDLVVLAGNVVPLVDRADLAAVPQRLAHLLLPGGLLVAGFGLDPDHLPDGCPPLPLSTWTTACRAADLTEQQHRAGWDGTPLAEAADGTEPSYVVTVHRHDA
jgi:SAM-dependent methyltransferase